MATLKELRNERLRKLEELKKQGLDPYPPKANRTVNLIDVTKDFDKLNGQQVSVAGRIENIRKFGSIAFMVIRDQSGRLQLFLEDNKVEAIDVASDASRLGFKELNLLDSGDFIEAQGEVIKTKTDEISVDVKTLRILSKSLRPLPTKQDGFVNKEERLRRRYVDMNVNLDVRDRFIRRSTVLASNQGLYE